MMAAIEEETAVLLRTLLEGLVDDEQLIEYGDVAVTGLAHDSRMVKNGDVFVAFTGDQTHGLMHAVDAVKKGAVVVVWDGGCENAEEIVRTVSSQVVCLHCPNLKMMVGEIADRFYDHPSSKLNVIGVTGTDGKTSISHFIAQCLDDLSGRCGVMGTLGNGFIGALNATGLTTAPAINIHQSLFLMRDQGGSQAVMEVSSHGLDQGRVNAVSFDTAVLSNLTQDHLDYHHTLEEYAAAKKKLFFMPGLRAAVINLDDAFGRGLALECRQHLGVWGYSVCPDISDLKKYSNYIVHARKIEIIENGYRLAVQTPKGSGNFTIGLLGSFNVTNVLATLATLLINGVSFEEAIKRLHVLHAVPGRMETIRVQDKPTVIIDYAHTPNALEWACKTVSEHFGGELWCVFGCGGDRDRSKRPLMAKAAEQFCNKIIITSDNPRHEDPQKIIDQIMQGFSEQGEVKVIVDRKQAIEYAINSSGKNDVVLLAGKGHESSQIVGDSYIAFSDSRVAKDCLGVLT